MRIIAIDPGPVQTAMIVLCPSGKLRHYQSDNTTIRHTLGRWVEYDDRNTIVIEDMQCYGMPVGKSTFRTCYQIGRLIQVSAGFSEVWLLGRVQVKTYMCGSSRAKDANVRRACIDRYEPTGGGATPQVGTKKQPGPLYGMSKDKWAALAVGLTFQAEPQRAEFLT